MSEYLLWMDSQSTFFYHIRYIAGLLIIRPNENFLSLLLAAIPPSFILRHTDFQDVRHQNKKCPGFAGASFLDMHNARLIALSVTFVVFLWTGKTITKWQNENDRVDAIFSLHFQ